MGGKGAWRWEERESIYLSLHCHHQNDSCIKMGGDESHFNVDTVETPFLLTALGARKILSP